VLDNVPAWAANRLALLVKAPKRYLLDPALAAAAAGLTARGILTDSGLTGGFFDAFGTAQFRPEIALLHPRPTLHHLRETHGRQEVDLVIDIRAGRVVGIEFKAGATPDSRDAKAPGGGSGTSSGMASLPVRSCIALWPVRARRPDLRRPAVRSLGVTVRASEATRAGGIGGLR